MSLLCGADKLLAPPAADSDGESDGSDRVPVPSFQNSFSQAIEKALLQLDTGAASPPQAVVEPGVRIKATVHSSSSYVTPGVLSWHLFLCSSLASSLSDDKGGKKKKKKQKLLFSTSMVHTK